MIGYLLPGMALDLGELELGVVRVHLTNLFPCRRSQHLDDLHQLIDARVTWENRLAQEQFSKYTTGTPNICKRDLNRY